jgi:hypothetical protein
MFIAAMLAGSAAFSAHWALAQLVTVPIELQSELLAKVAAYDRNMQARSGERVQILLLTNGSDTESKRFAVRMQSALQTIGPIAGLPHDEHVAAFTSGAELAEDCRRRRLAIIVVGPSLGEQVSAIRDALNGVNVLTVAAVPGYVEPGIVLGFDVVSGKPKLLIHLTQARRQHVEMRAEVLKLMRVFE